MIRVTTVHRSSGQHAQQYKDAADLTTAAPRRYILILQSLTVAICSLAYPDLTAPRALPGFDVHMCRAAFESTVSQKDRIDVVSFAA